MCRKVCTRSPKTSAEEAGQVPVTTPGWETNTRIGSSFPGTVTQVAAGPYFAITGGTACAKSTSGLQSSLSTGGGTCTGSRLPDGLFPETSPPEAL